MMPKLPPPPSILMPFQIDAVDRWAKDYGRAVAEACADRCRTVIYEGSNTAEECEDAIRKAAEELGK